MAYIEHKLGKTFYLSKGKDKDIPIICLHGGPGGTCNSLKPLLDLDPNRKVYIYDQIGAGKSSQLDSKKWKIETFVKELDLLVKAWGIKEFHLFGGSWGTTLALEYYLRKEGKGIKSLIFQSPMFSAKDWEDDGKMLIKKLPRKTQKVINYCHEIGATDSKVYSEAVFEYYLKHVLRNKKKLEDMMTSSSGFNAKLYEYMWGPSEFKPTGTLKGYSKVSSLKEIKVPTLFICGEYDEATPKTAKKYSNKIKSSSVAVLKGCSHSISNENPKLLIKTINNFLEQV